MSSDSRQDSAFCDFVMFVTKTKTLYSSKFLMLLLIEDASKIILIVETTIDRSS